MRNGADYLEQSIASILGQSYRNLELLVSDNASTDATDRICEHFARHDRRLRYSRNAHDAGAARNYSLVFDEAAGRYFKWAAHDDVLEPDFLRRCVDVLESDDGAVLCYTASATIDAAGERGGQQGAVPGLDAVEAAARFHATFAIGEPIPVWGVVRTEVLRRTGLLGPFLCHDRTLLAELALHGRLRCVDEVLFLHREHPHRSVRVHDYGRPDLVIGWYAPERQGRLVMAEWRLLGEYLAALRRAPAARREKARCLAYLIARSVRRPRRFGRDLLLAAAQLPPLRQHVLRLYERAQSSGQGARPGG